MHCARDRQERASSPSLHRQDRTLAPREGCSFLRQGEAAWPIFASSLEAPRGPGDSPCPRPVSGRVTDCLAQGSRLTTAVGPRKGWGARLH